MWTNRQKRVLGAFQLVVGVGGLGVTLLRKIEPISLVIAALLAFSGAVNLWRNRQLGA